MRRRDFLAVVGGAAAWPVAALAQQARVRRVGVLTAYAEDDPEGVERAAALRQGLRAVGWIEGSTLQIDFRWSAGDADRLRSLAAELVRQAPDVLVTSGTPPTLALKGLTGTIPIIFTNVADPVSSGLVASLAHPGGNVTGFANYEYSLGGKWLEVLKEVAPAITRVLYVNNPGNPAAGGLSEAIESVARQIGVRVTQAPVRIAAEVERAIGEFAREPGGGLIVQPDATIAGHRDLLIPLAERHRLPAVYPFRYYPTAGGLISYGVEASSLVRQSADYVDRVLKGAKASDLPVQLPTKFELVVNLKTAKALGLAIPESFLLRADEVIE